MNSMADVVRRSAQQLLEQAEVRLLQPLSKEQLQEIVKMIVYSKKVLNGGLL